MLLEKVLVVSAKMCIYEFLIVIWQLLSLCSEFQKSAIFAFKDLWIIGCDVFKKTSEKTLSYRFLMI